MAALRAGHFARHVFDRQEGFDMVRWVAYRHGFGTYMHFVKGFLSQDTQADAKKAQAQLVKRARGNRSRVHLDTIISPSYTSAIAQCIQLPGISGKGNNLFLMEYSPDQPANRDQLLDNFRCCWRRRAWTWRCSEQRSEVWQQARHPFVDHARRQRQLQLDDFAGLHLAGPSRMEEASISVFFLARRRECKEEEEALRASILEGRLPIAEQNIEHVTHDSSSVQTIKNKSGGADLVILGIHPKRHRNHGRRRL